MLAQGIGVLRPRPFGGVELVTEDLTQPGPIGIGAHRLNGAPAIAAFLGERVGPTYYLLEKGLLPAAKQGETWIASKRVLLAHYERLLNPAGAATGNRSHERPGTTVPRSPAQASAMRWCHARPLGAAA